MNGLVLKSTGSWYSVLAEDNRVYQCRVRGKLRIKGMKTTNPVAVGDQVHLSADKENPGQAVIQEVSPRTNYIVRQSVKKSAQAHIIAANIDQALLVVTLVYPRTSLGFIDRFLVTAESFRIPQVLVFNKTDLLSDEGVALQKDIMAIYENIGIQCLETSALTGKNINDVKNLLSNKKTLFSGHSGVGKSTIANLIAPHITQKTSEISDFAEKGVHTTTFAEMFQLDATTFLIDTPGIKELGLVEIESFELADYFPEMRELRNDCKFNNCQHVQEPGCAIKKALEKGEIEESRYHSYVSMLYGEDNRR
ncbi:ribosome small subunit-dependent GTPase A [Fulvivirga sp. M361]|uniref:ribosome small subunit-dependent GTPase A n=1 Tax=Fulvivirga sp. M361 TaxID=2594266 RepID=UPI0011799684|nr:ribosome small subunit-dependent GTPase A [Fulvivirga sp. M361]TRX57784.1 ribosome small subunit-dependent GTPase A [Fulvivirga sp. M361]